LLTSVNFLTLGLNCLLLPAGIFGRGPAEGGFGDGWSSEFRARARAYLWALAVRGRARGGTDMVLQQQEFFSETIESLNELIRRIEPLSRATGCSVAKHMIGV
jgi:hypothetical protein